MFLNLGLLKMCGLQSTHDKQGKSAMDLKVAMVEKPSVPRAYADRRHPKLLKPYIPSQETNWHTELKTDLAYRPIVPRSSHWLRNKLAMFLNLLHVLCLVWQQHPKTLEDNNSKKKQTSYQLSNPFEIVWNDLTSQVLQW